MAAQATEMANLANDYEHACKMGMHPHYSAITSWLCPIDHGKVLELGCGPGKFVALMANIGFNVVAVDPYEFDNWKLIEEQQNIEFQSGIFAENLPFPDATFDAITCLGALLYFEDPHAALVEMKLVLKPGGRIIVRNPNPWNLYTLITNKRLDKQSSNLYRKSELISLLEFHGFVVGQVRTYGFWPPFFTDFWWYLINVWIGRGTQRFLSMLTPAAFHVNITVYATSPSKSVPPQSE